MTSIKDNPEQFQTTNGSFTTILKIIKIIIKRFSHNSLHNEYSSYHLAAYELLSSVCKIIQFNNLFDSTILLENVV